jgi:hypothetical protein
MDTWTDRHKSPHKFFFKSVEYCLIMEGYEHVIIVCYMKLEGPFSVFLLATLCVCVCVCVCVSVCPSTCDIWTVIILFTRHLLNLVTHFFKKKLVGHTQVSWKLAQCPSHITLYLSLKWISACTLNIYWPVWVKFGTTDRHILPQTKFEFCEDLRSNSYTLLQRNNEILPVLYTSAICSQTTSIFFLWGKTASFTPK